MSCVLQFTVIFGAGVVCFSALNVFFGMLVASTLAPWGRDSGGVGSTKRDTLGDRVLFLAKLEQQVCFLSCVFTGHVFQ